MPERTRVARKMSITSRNAPFKPPFTLDLANLSPSDFNLQQGGELSPSLPSLIVASVTLLKIQYNNMSG